MNIKRKSTGNWSKAYKNFPTADEGRERAIQEISQLLNTLDVTKIGPNIGTIHPPNHRRSDTEGWRVDLQSPSVNEYNVQVQKNGAGNPSTIACVLVPKAMISGIGVKGTSANMNAAVDARASELRYAVHGALIRSVRTLRQDGSGNYEIEQITLTGTYSCSSPGS